MLGTEKVDFYDQHKPIIHEAIKTESKTKPLWRKLYWTTAKDSYEYKTGCVAIFKTYFQDLYLSLTSNFQKK